MSYLDKYAIQFSNLKPGCFNYQFNIEEKFFEQFAESEIKQGNLTVDVHFEKQSQLLILLCEIKGTVILSCDRCLENLDWDMDVQFKLFVKFGDTKSEETDELICIPESSHEINIAQYLYEYIHLVLPVQRVHGNDENGVSLCNKEILAKLESLKSKEIETTDSRWELLKKIKFN